MTSSASSKRPKALLFDIGGVCVVSPFRAILDYEKAHDIPVGWINHSIAGAAPNGAWQRIERGEIPLDDVFFADFARDLGNPELWAKFWEKRKKGHAPPPPPMVDAKAMFWEMMRVSRAPDPWMWPAVRALGQREGADAGRLVLGALSNTVVFPEGVRDERGDAFESGLSGQSSGDVRDAFDVFVSSAHVGLRKPDPEIYLMAVRLMDQVARQRGVEGGIEAGDVLFLDDIGQNLRAARELGMRTLKVELGRSWKAVRELEEVTGLKLLKGGVPAEKARL